MTRFFSFPPCAIYVLLMIFLSDCGTIISLTCQHFLRERRYHPVSEELDENKAPRNLRSLMRYFRFSSATEAVTKSIQKYKNEKLSRFGLKSMHLTFLCCLYKAEDGMTSAELARECGVDKAFISRITHELEKLGYIDCLQSHPLELRYKKKLRLTERGRDIMAAVDEMIDDAVTKLTDGIPDEKIDDFYKVLSLLDGRLRIL